MAVFVFVSTGLLLSSLLLLNEKLNNVFCPDKFSRALTLKVKLKMKVKFQNRTIKLLKPKGLNTVIIDRFGKNFGPGFRINTF
jgi:hypothetical protein